MKSRCVCVVLAVLVSAGCGWVLKSNRIDIIPRLTEDVILECLWDGPDNSKPLHIGSVTRVRLIKRNANQKWETFAKILHSDVTRVIFPNPNVQGIMASGKIGKTLQETFLKLTWSKTSAAVLGTYMCEIDGFNDITDTSVPFLTNTVTLMYDNNVTLQDLLNIAVSLKTKLNAVSDELQSQEMERNTEHQKLKTIVLNQVEDEVEDSYFEVRNWPTGSYSLLSDAAGCPHTQNSLFDSAYIQIQTETTDKPKHNFSTPTHLVTDLCKNCGTRNILEFRFCSNSKAEPRLLWPQGSYCIHRLASSCPAGFSYGYTRFFLKSLINFIEIRRGVSSYTIGTNIAGRYFDLQFCCRNDGDVSRPILLPNDKGFYLYRYKGQCQAVANTKVTNEWIHLDTDDSKADAWSNGYHADGRLNKGTLELCYYTKNHDHQP